MFGMYNHMLLSELNGMIYKEFEDQSSAKTRMCENLLSTLRTLKEREKYYTTIIYTLLNVTTVIYADKGIIWLPKCFLLTNFKLDTDRNKNCFKDLKVKVTIWHSNKTKDITLNSNSIFLSINSRIIMRY